MSEVAKGGTGKGEIAMSGATKGGTRSQDSIAKGGIGKGGSAKGGGTRSRGSIAMSTAARSETASEIEICFRALLERIGYRNISVTSICDRMGISRKTFYTYYPNREAIVEAAFYRDVVKPSDELLELLGFDQLHRLQPNMHERQFKAINADGPFYRDLTRPGAGGGEAFLRVAHAGFYGMNRDILTQVGFSRDERRIDYAASYFASAKAELLLKWIGNGFDMTPRQLTKLYESMALPFWNNLA